MKPWTAGSAMLAGGFSGLAAAIFLWIACEATDGAGWLDPVTRPRFMGYVSFGAILFGGLAGLVVWCFWKIGKR